MQPETLPNPDPSVRLEKASRFNIDELTTIYNLTRIDYMIPMGMDAAHLKDYCKIYSVDLERSWVALDGDRPIGLAMLGMRPGRAWVTRLGVLASARRHGLGGLLVSALLESAASAGLGYAVLEVISGNRAAHALFRRLGFAETRELLVLRRPPGELAALPEGEPEWLEASAALDLLAAYPSRLPWTNEPETYRAAGDAQGLRIDLPAAAGEDPARGWLVFRCQPDLLTHFVLHTETGSPARACRALLAHLYRRYPTLASYVENVPAADLHAPELERLGLVESFRRIEMERGG